MEFYRYHNYRENVVLETFKLVEETDKGYWITHLYWDKPKWVSKTSCKRYAYPTKDEAMYSFKQRKYRQRKLLQGQLEVVDKVISKFGFISI